MNILRHKIGQHALSLYDGTITLSKNGYVQSSTALTRDGQYDAMCHRLELWYETHGEDFLADLKFIDYVFWDEVS